MRMILGKLITIMEGDPGQWGSLLDEAQAAWSRGDTELREVAEELRKILDLRITENRVGDTALFGPFFTFTQTGSGASVHVTWPDLEYTLGKLDAVLDREGS